MIVEEQNVISQQPVAICRYFAQLGSIAGENIVDNLFMNMYVETIDSLRKGTQYIFKKTCWEQ